MMARLLYLIPVTMSLLAICTFLSLKVAPAYSKIFADFGLGLPPMSAVAMNGSALFAVDDDTMGKMIELLPFTWLSLNGWNLMDVAALLFSQTLILVGLILFLIIWLQWRGTMRPWLPVLKQIIWWADMARCCACWRWPRAAGSRFQTRSPRPPGCTPAGSCGGGWRWSRTISIVARTGSRACASAADRRGRRRTAQRCRAPEQSHLGSVANGRQLQRRAGNRLQAWSQFFLPLVILPFGLVVAVLAIGYFLPIAYLVRSLS